MEENFVGKLWDSIGSTDSYILIFAILAVIFLALSLWLSGVVDKDLQQNLSVNRVHQLLGVFYTLFITFISLFPLLGMFGTVKSLLELDLSGDLEQIKLKFFNALTSTAWGIVFSVLFKIIHAIFQSWIEGQLTKAQNSVEREKALNAEAHQKEGDQYETQRDYS